MVSSQQGICNQINFVGFYQNTVWKYTKQHDIISLGFELESYFSRTPSIYFLLAFDLVCAKTNTTANYHTLTTPYISQTDGNGLIFFSFTVYYQVCTKTKAFKRIFSQQINLSLQENKTSTFDFVLQFVISNKW